jgi:hypothetical protein
MTDPVKRFFDRTATVTGNTVSFTFGNPTEAAEAIARARVAIGVDDPNQLPALDRSPAFVAGARWGLRQATAWLHALAAEMKDRKARDILNSAAFGMGMWKGDQIAEVPRSDRSDDA